MKRQEIWMWISFLFSSIGIGYAWVEWNRDPNIILNRWSKTFEFYGPWVTLAFWIFVIVGLSMLAIRFWRRFI